MATFSITISNSLRLFGGGPPTRWGSTHPAMTWGISKWGEGNPIIRAVRKVALTETLSLNDSYGRIVGKVVISELLVLNTLVAASLRDSAGWSQVFANHTTDVVQRDIATYASWTPQIGRAHV